MVRSSLEDAPTLVSATCVLNNFVIDEHDGIWDPRAAVQRRNFHLANALTVANEMTCPRDELQQDKTSKSILT
ncbi:hypothetical protein GN244_ATG02057 [Phytophthora infestans]|uniref:Uncharacterized protein n=1 Tax=Phytophthora infestans TaxID=4787 RepID=A0A833WMF2_PHYIN|nr:hypothetical protein GN244_ATG02057 [Phytophthora infestans]KAF4140032.1 hypothetical protein GN958_ATG10782 [Phytophthora infestans]